MNAFLENRQNHGLSDDEGAQIIGTTYGAGVGTSSVTLGFFTLAMIHYPHWLRLLQDEVDRVVGSDRLPTFYDIEDLLTVRAVVKETLRWRPVTATGIPHKLIKDNIYEDMFLAAGTTVHFNEW